MSVTQGGIDLERLERMSLEEISFWVRMVNEFEREKVKALEEASFSSGSAEL